MRWRGVLSRLARVSSKRQTIAPDIGARLAEQVTWGTRFLITTNLCFYGLVESGRIMHQSIVAQLLLQWVGGNLVQTAQSTLRVRRLSCVPRVLNLNTGQAPPVPNHRL